MRPLLIAWLLALPATAIAAPAKIPPPPPCVTLEFFDSPDAWVMTLEMTTYGGAKYALDIELDDKKEGNAYRMMAQYRLIKADWCSEYADGFDGRSVHIYGVRTKNGKADPVKTLVLTNWVRRGEGKTPRLTEARGAKVETRVGKEAERPLRGGMRPPPGPRLDDEPYIEFDFSPMPERSQAKWFLRVDTQDPATYLKVPIGGVASPKSACLSMEWSLNEIGYRAITIGKTKLRVYGNVRENRFYSAKEGSVGSDELKEDQLPKVTNPKPRDR